MRPFAIVLALLALGGGASCGTAVKAPTAVRAAPTDDVPDDSESDGDDDAGAVEPARDGGRSGGKDASVVSDGGRYASVESLQDGELRTALHELVANHVSLGYDAARDAMFGITGQFDLTDGMLECIYTGRKVAPDGTHIPSNFNTEHTWPQSFGASTEPARSDLHHLFPVDESANNARANFPFADTDCAGATCGFDNGGSRLGPIAGGSATVFEVRPERRGDVARGMFYFAVRYEKPIDPDEEAALREWNDADPPDVLESARNDAIEGYQKNRNPFVDRPDFVARILDF
jgi:endonuclease I